MRPTGIGYVYISQKEYAERMTAWEKKTGMCSRCAGTGEVFQSISVADGIKYQQCPKCKGQGRPPLTPPKTL